MKKIYFLSITFFLLFAVYGEHVEVSTAKQVAKNYYSNMCELNQVQAPGIVSLSLSFELTASDFLSSDVNSSHISLMYIFNINENDGFVIMSADDRFYPILGYSMEGEYSGESVPPGLLGLLDQYAQEMNYVLENSNEKSIANEDAWSTYLKGSSNLKNKSFTSVNPLVATQWNQSPHVNDLCPFDYTYYELTVTGCPATAMAQIMKYWNYPETGTSYHSYDHSTYGTLSANFEATTYDYGSMPNQVNSTNNAVATLMYHCGVAVDMQYGVAQTGGSGGYVIEAHSPVQHCCEYAFKTYFDYKPSMQGLFKDDYDDATWVQMLKGDLDASRPIQYAGFGQGGGHTWVCDGYDNNNFFHMNWGWGGVYDGYFTLNDLAPGTGGIGGGSGNFNSGQQALIGIEPNTGGGGGSQFDLRAYSNISITPNPIDFANTFDVSVQIGNFDDSDFSGSLSAVLFNSEGEFVDFIQELSGVNLAVGYFDTYNFYTDGMLATPGAYFVGIYYKPSGGDWAIIGEGDYSNYVSVDIVGPENTIQLYSDITVDPVPIVSNAYFLLSFDIANYGSQNFSGEVSADLYDSEGNYLYELANINLEISSGYYIDDITLSCQVIDVDPGSYILAIWDKPSGGDWALVGSDDYSNPITVQIAAPQIEPDPYENNDEEALAYNLPFNMSGNQITLYTVGSNIHFGNDWDFYKIELPAGSQYKITPRAHDSYNSGTGETYTDDVLWAFGAGGNWSDTYDDVMEGYFVVDGGQTVFLVVSNYYQGQMGSYLLEIPIEKGSFGIDELNENLLSIYPNPASDHITIHSTNWNELKPPITLLIRDLSGKVAYELNDLYLESNDLTIDISHLNNGMYILLMEGNQAYIKKKLVIVK